MWCNSHVKSNNIVHTLKKCEFSHLNIFLKHLGSMIHKVVCDKGNGLFQYIYHVLKIYLKNVILCDGHGHNNSNK